MAYILPAFKGYTFDFRLKQIRRIPYGTSMMEWEFIEMDSLEGQQLLQAFFQDEDAKEQLRDYLTQLESSGYDLNWWYQTANAFGLELS